MESPGREVSITREELYHLVWSETMGTLDKVHGIPRPKLIEECERLRVPRPSRDYWNMMGKRMKPLRTPLPLLEEASPQTATIKLRDGTWEPLPSHAGRIAQAPSYEADILEVLTRVEALPKVQVSAQLSASHQLVKLAKRGFAKAKPDMHGRVTPLTVEDKRPLDIEVAPQSVDRALRIFDALIKAVEKLGGEVSVDEVHFRHNTYVTLVSDFSAQVRLLERTKQYSREVAKDDLYSHKFRYEPLGVFELDSGKGFWHVMYAKDTKTAKLEDQINKVLQQIVHQAGKARIYQRNREAEDRKRAEQEKRAKELKELQNQEQKKINMLLEDVKNWRKSQDIRAYLATIRKLATDRGVNIDHGTEFGKRMMWAESIADRFDPTREPPPSILDEEV